MKTIDLYCRISQDYDGTLRAVEDQEKQGREAVQAAGHQVGVVHRDHALSAWNPKVDRPSFNALMARLESGDAEGVWVRDLDRFTRKVSEAEALLQAAVAGAEVLAGHSTYDLTTARGKRGFREDAVDAAYESDRISERSSRGKRAKVANRGRSNASWRGFARPGFLLNGPEWMPGDPRVEVPAEQLSREVEAVREAVDSLLAGGTLHAIAKAWNDEGLLTVKGKRWDGAALRQLLVSPSLAGHLTHKGEIVGKAEGEPVIDPTTWDRLMLLFASRTRGRTATKYLLSGILACGKCGGRLYGRPLTSKAPYPVTGDEALDADRTARQYWCQIRPREDSGCGGLCIDMRYVDDVVAAMTVERLGDPKHATRVAKVAQRMESAQADLLAELKRLNDEADALAGKTGQPGWTVARVDAALANYAPLMDDVKARLKDLGQVPTADAHLADSQAVWDRADTVARRELVKRAFPEGLTIAPSTSSGKAALKPGRVVPGGYTEAA